MVTERRLSESLSRKLSSVSISEALFPNSTRGRDIPRPKGCESVLELQTMELELHWHIHARATDIFLRHLPRHRPIFGGLDIIII
jgi:hypothetical protein